MLVVDTNAGENAVFESLLGSLGPDVVTRERLDVADVHVRVPGGGRILVERKTWNDFVASLRDSRYSEQKLRLLAERERAREAGERLDVVYVIETRFVPTWDAKTAGMPNNQPLAALTKMTIRDGISVLYASSPEDTARQIRYIHDAALKKGFDGDAHATKVAASGYAGAARTTNKRKAAEAAGFQMMLATVNGCSGAKAEAVAERFKSAAALVRAYDELPPAAADKLLADLEVNGKRLGPALSAKIRAALCE